MNRQTKLQLVGPAAVIIAVAGAEIAAAALARWPSSEMLWRINLEWFHAFQRSSYALSAYDTLGCSQFWIIAVPLIALMFCGATFKRPLLLAAASNLSLVYASFVLCADYLYDQSWREASLSFMTVSSSPHFLFCVVLVAASLLSFTVSHVYYIRAVRDGLG
jgi:hypothetical protein